MLTALGPRYAARTTGAVIERVDLAQGHLNKAFGARNTGVGITWRPQGPNPIEPHCGLLAFGVGETDSIARSERTEGL